MTPCEPCEHGTCQYDGTCLCDGSRRLRESTYALRLTRDPFYLEKGEHVYEVHGGRRSRYVHPVYMNTYDLEDYIWELEYECPNREECNTRTMDTHLPTASQRDVFSVHDAERFGGDQSQRRDGPHAGVPRLAGDGRRERPRQHDRGRGVRLHRRHERRHDGRLHREDESQAVRKDDARVRRGVGLRQAVGLRRRREVALHPRAELGAGERGGPADANVAVHGSGERVVREQRERAPAAHKHDEPRSVRQGRGGVSAHPRSGLLHDLDRASAHTRRDVRGWLRRVVLRRQVRSVRRDARNVSVRRHVRVRGGMVRRRVR